MTKTRIALLIVVAVLIAAYLMLDPGQYLGPACAGQLLSLDCFNSQQAAIEAFYQAQPIAVALVFFAIYVVVTGLSIPGATIMTLAAGALFGLLWGTIIVSFASSLGATLAFLVARFVLRDTVQKRFSQRLKAINEGVRKDGAFYLFALRLVPVFPFFVINLVMGLTPMRALTFYGVSQIGMLAGTIVYVNAGLQLSQLDSLAGIASPSLIVSFALLGLFPLIARKGLDVFKKRRALSGYHKPKSFDRNLIVIGAGSGGLVASLIAATVKARVTLIEKNAMGGDCLHTGCVPSKTLIRTARLVAEINNSKHYGIHTAHAEFDFRDIMQRVRDVIATIETHDSAERFEALGVDCIAGDARLVDPWTVAVNGQRLTARAIVLATGAEPFVPPIDGFDDIEYLTSDNLWSLTRLPDRLLVLGGGPVGCEMSQAFARLGSRVVQVEQVEQLLTMEDPEIAERAATHLRGDGVDLRLGHKAVRVEAADDGRQLVCEAAGETVRIGFDRLLVAIGRKANTEGFGLEELGIAVDGAIEVNEHLQTSIPSVFACGDAIGPYQLTHAASHQAWFAAINGLFGHFRKFKVDYSTLPWCTFTDPQIAHVGHNETSANAAGIEYEVTTYDLAGLDRALAEGAAHGVVKVLTKPGKDKVLGATIVAEAAGELITEFVTAMKQGIGLNKILGTIHAYPTLAEANKFAAGEWKKAHAPEWVFPILTRLHAWRRG